jgi:hypothetical protein
MIRGTKETHWRVFSIVRGVHSVNGYELRVVRIAVDANGIKATTAPRNTIKIKCFRRHWSPHEGNARGSMNENEPGKTWKSESWSIEFPVADA